MTQYVPLKNVFFPRGHPIYGFLSLRPNWNLDKFSLFCRADGHEQQADTQTCQATPFVVIGGVYSMRAMQPINN